MKLNKTNEVCKLQKGELEQFALTIITLQYKSELRANENKGFS